MSVILENTAAILWIILGIATAYRLRQYDQRASAIMCELEQAAKDNRH